MTEGDAWDGLRPILKKLGLDPIRVENVLHPGHPDVDYTHGNIELKYLEAFPKRGTTSVKLPKLTAEQVTWITRRSSLGGLAFLLVRVSREWFLMRGEDVHDIKWQGLTESDWRSRAALVFTTSADNTTLALLGDILRGKVK